MAKEEPPSLSQPVSTRLLRVLLAEDAPASRSLSARILQRRGHSVATAEDGQQALQLVREQDFDVVLMDVQMPVLDGLQAAAEIRALEDRNKAKVTIIALTASTAKDDLQRCLEAGMDASLSKPFQATELVEMVERLANGPARPGCSEKGGPPAETAGTRGTDVDQAAPPAASPKVFDLAEAVARSLGKYDLFQQMVDYFYQEADPLLEHMRAAVAEGNAEELVYAAHRLKGTILYVGSPPAMEGVERLERIGLLGDLEPAAAAIRDVERWIDLLKPALAPHRTHGAKK